MDVEMKDELSITAAEQNQATEQGTGPEQSLVERLAAAAGMLHQVAERLAQRETSFTLDAEATLSRIVATIESRTETELEQKLASAEARLAAAEQTIAGLKHAELSASAPSAVTNSGRKTLPVAMTNLLAKQGVTVDSMEAGALDAALISLSVEQRIAVKAQLLRAGLLS